jgi:hypothetical protein
MPPPKTNPASTNGVCGVAHAPSRVVVGAPADNEPCNLRTRAQRDLRHRHKKPKPHRAIPFIHKIPKILSLFLDRIHKICRIDGMGSRAKPQRRKRRQKNTVHFANKKLAAKLPPAKRQLHRNRCHLPRPFPEAPATSHPPRYALRMFFQSYNNKLAVATRIHT